MKKDHKYMEKYRNQDIFIYGMGREWWWRVVINNRVKNSPICYYSVNSAIYEAKKYIDKKIL